MYVETIDTNILRGLSQKPVSYTEKLIFLIQETLSKDLKKLSVWRQKVTIYLDNVWGKF